MAGLKEIRRRIGSVQNTKQITRAMKLVSAAKLRRAQDAAERGRAYCNHLTRVMSELLKQLPADFSHPLLEKRAIVLSKRVVMICGERGLCGAYNTNVVKSVQAQEFKSGIKVDVLAVGRRAVGAAKHRAWSVAGQYEGLSEDISRWPIEEIAAKCMDDFVEGKCDEVVLYYTQFVSALTQRVTKVTLLPFSQENVGDLSRQGGAGKTSIGGEANVKYDPPSDEIFRNMIPVLIRSQLYQAGAEAKASEHAARMTAMDSATNNADDLIGKLRLHYNRARQSAITKELLDIIGGAEAIS